MEQTTTKETRVSLRLGAAKINGKNYDGVLLLAAPFEKQAVQTNPSVLFEKLFSQIDDTLSEEIASNPGFIFCTAIELHNVREYKSILSYCGYEATEDTIIAIRAFGLSGFDDKGIPDYVEHLSCKVSFNEDKIIFISSSTEDSEDAQTDPSQFN